MRDTCNGSERDIKYSQRLSEHELDKWLKSGDTDFLYRFNYGASNLGSPWREEIPVTPVLLAGLAKGKVEIYAEYDWNMLVGGLCLYIRKLESVTDDDVNGMIITREQFDKHMKEQYGHS